MNTRKLLILVGMILLAGLTLLLGLSNAMPAYAASAVLSDNLSNDYGGYFTINSSAWVGQVFTTTASN